MNTSTLVMLGTLAVLVGVYMARRRNRLSQED
jgi:LPXTG-motif cell wall-anchored protein